MENNQDKLKDDKNAAEKRISSDYKVGYGHPPIDKQFKKGEVHNPTGYKGISIKDSVVKELNDHPELVKQIVTELITNPKNFQFITEIIDGKAKQSIDLKGDIALETIKELQDDIKTILENKNESNDKSGKETL